MKNLIGKGYRLVEMCSMTGISRQAYYKRLKKESHDTRLYDQVEAFVIKNRKEKSRAGLRAIYYKEGLATMLGVNRFEKQMSLRGHALKPYRSFMKTTDSRGHHYKFGNLIMGKEVNGTNQVIVGDITYYRNHSNLFFIFTFTDIYSLDIKGIYGSKNMEGKNAERCLRQVMRYNNQYKYNWQLIIHTDAGGQYRSDAFQLMLTHAGIIPSHAETCLENGLAERINGITKNEYLIDHNIKNVRQLNTVLKHIQYQHNEVWPSSKLGWVTPRQYAQWTDGLSPRKRPVKKVKEIIKPNKGFI